MCEARGIWAAVIVQLAFAMAPSETPAQEALIFAHPSAGAEGATVFTGISGNTIVGYWRDATRSDSTSFVYDVANRTYRDLAFPGARHTQAEGIAGSKIVGSYVGTDLSLQRGFIYDMGTGTFTSITHPLAGPGNAYETQLLAIDDAGRTYGFARDWSIDFGTGFVRDAGGTFTDVRYPGASDTRVTGSDGNLLVGTFDFFSSFVYDGAQWTIVRHPNADRDTSVSSIDGNRIVGSYAIDRFTGEGFIHDLGSGSWTSIDPGGHGHSAINDIEGNVIVGAFSDGTLTRAYVAFIPEPSLASSVALVSLVLMSRRRSRCR